MIEQRSDEKELRIRRQREGERERKANERFSKMVKSIAIDQI